MTGFKFKVLLVFIVATVATACGGADDEQGSAGDSEQQHVRYATHAQGDNIQSQTVGPGAVVTERQASDELLLGVIYDPELAVFIIKKIVEELPERLTASLAVITNKEISKLLMVMRLFGEVSSDEFNELKHVLSSRYELGESHSTLIQLTALSRVPSRLSTVSPQHMCANAAAQNFVILTQGQSAQESYNAALELVFCASQNQCAFCLGFKELLLR